MQTLANAVVMKTKEPAKPAMSRNKKNTLKGKEAPFPTDVMPMLATLVEKPVSERDGCMK